MNEDWAAIKEELIDQLKVNLTLLVIVITIIVFLTAF